MIYSVYYSNQGQRYKHFKIKFVRIVLFFYLRIVQVINFLKRLDYYKQECEFVLYFKIKFRNMFFATSCF